MKKRLKEIEEEAGALREMQAKVEKEMGAVQGSFFLFLFCWVCIWSGVLAIFLNNFDLNSDLLCVLNWERKYLVNFEKEIKLLYYWFEYVFF